jgi:succinyl-diaminopimelate desuccinylase
MAVGAEASQARAALQRSVADTKSEVIATSKRLLGVPSAYPPGDTRDIAAEIEAMVRDVEGVEISRHPGAEHVMNLALRVIGARPGKRLVMNGHLDTFPLGDRSDWSANPQGEERDGKLFGLGVSDMKGGLAAMLFALKHMARCRDTWAGELVLTVAGDEESMGVLGSKLMIDTVPYAKGDAVLNADVGSPSVLRLGEKGMIWLTLKARGKSAHAAHVHKGDSAIDKLLAVIAEMQKLRDWKVPAPAEVIEAIDQASKVSEALSGKGESDVLKAITVTFGTISGGRLSNLIADAAQATADIRLPYGVSVSEVEAEIKRIVNIHPGVELEISRRYEPSWTSPSHELVGILKSNCSAILHVDPVVNMRVGASDARHYRTAGMATVVCGLTPHNMGAADEFVFCDELMGLAEIYAMTAYDYLA